MYSFFIGVDVSKLTLDVSYWLFGKTNYLGAFENSEEGYLSIVEELNTKTNYGISKWFFCFENTGVYSKTLLFWLHAKGIAFREENPIQICKSLGLKRGKNDKADSKAICKYAVEKRDSIQATKVSNPLVIKLKSLVLRRDFLVKQKTSIQASFNMQKQILDKELLKLYRVQTMEVVSILTLQITQIEKEMNECIERDSHLSQNDKLIQSVVGVGPVISAFIMAYTNNFDSFDNPRKFASYIGIAPFPNSSGEYIGKTKVSQLANKKIKSLMSNAALSAIRHDPQLKIYFERKLKEGKSKGSVLNAVKNKLLQRIYAVVKRQTPYVKFQYV